MNFKKKLNHEDINNFLPDNLTVCTSNYFQKKLGEKMPKYISDILELKSRPEHDNENKENMIEMVKEEYIQEGYNLWKEYEDRLKSTESITPLKNDLDELDKLEELKIDDTN
jgi:hypothetical protein